MRATRARPTAMSPLAAVAVALAAAVASIGLFAVRAAVTQGAAPGSWLAPSPELMEVASQCESLQDRALRDACARRMLAAPWVAGRLPLPHQAGAALRPARWQRPGGRNGDGSPAPSALSTIAVTPVDVGNTPDLAAHTFEVFKAGSSVAADTFVARNVGKPLAVATAARLPWASTSAHSLKYADPNRNLTGELSNATLSWATASRTPWALNPCHR